jgi:hypothetical protein
MFIFVASEVPMYLLDYLLISSLRQVTIFRASKTSQVERKEMHEIKVHQSVTATITLGTLHKFYI